MMKMMIMMIMMITMITMMMMRYGIEKSFKLAAAARNELSMGCPDNGNRRGRHLATRSRLSKMFYLTIMTLLLVGGYAIPTAPPSNVQPRTSSTLGFHQPLPGTALITFHSRVWDPRFFETHERAPSVMMNVDVGTKDDPQMVREYIKVLTVPDPVRFLIHLQTVWNMLELIYGPENINWESSINIIKRTLRGTALNVWRDAESQYQRSWAEAETNSLQEKAKTQKDIKAVAPETAPRGQDFLYGTVFFMKQKIGITERSAYDQRRYIELQMKPRWLDFDKYYQWLTFANNLLPFMAGQGSETQPFEPHELVEIMRRAVPEGWRLRFDALYPKRAEHTLDQTVTFFTAIQDEEKLTGSRRGKERGQGRNENRDGFRPRQYARQQMSNYRAQGNYRTDNRGYNQHAGRQYDSNRGNHDQQRNQGNSFHQRAPPQSGDRQAQRGVRFSPNQGRGGGDRFQRQRSNYNGRSGGQYQQQRPRQQQYRQNETRGVEIR